MPATPSPWPTSCARRCATRAAARPGRSPRSASPPTSCWPASLTGDVARRGHPLEHLGVRQREVAGGEVAALLELQRRLVLPADLLGLPAAGVEAAARRRVRRRRHVPGQDLALLGRREPRVG